MRDRTKWGERLVWAWVLACAALVATASCGGPSEAPSEGGRPSSEAEWVEVLIEAADIPDSLRPGPFDPCLDWPTGLVFDSANDARDEARRLLDDGRVEAARTEAVEGVRLAGVYAARTACGR